MEQTVYGDILFFVNFCMDFQCLFLTAKLLHRPFPLLRSTLAAAFGALYACVALFLSVTGWWAFAADCGVCLLMCTCVFWARDVGFHRLLVPFGVYFGVSAAIGGVMSGMAAMLSHIEMPMGADPTEVSSGMFFLLAILGGALTFFWGKLCQLRAKGKRADLTLTFSGERRTFRCMVDTANLLRDPLGGRPVALIDEGVVKGLLPASLLAAAQGGDPSVIAELPLELARRVRLIPANTVTGRGTLFAVMPDEALLDAGRGDAPVELLIAPAPLAVDHDDYTVLLPAELMME